MARRSETCSVEWNQVPGHKFYFFPPFSSTTRSPLPRRNTREHVCICTVHETRRKSSFGILSTNVRYILATDDNIISSGNDARYKRTL